MSSQCQRPIRVAVDGVASTGKTTLVNQLRDLFPQFKIVEEASRVIAPRFDVRTEADWQHLLKDLPKLELFFSAEEAWLQSNEDRQERTLIDSSMFLISAYRRAFGCKFDPSLAIARNYTLILYCPLNVGVCDGFRFLDGRDELDTHYRQIISQHFQGEFRPLPHGNFRLHFAADCIQEILMAAV